MNKNFLIIAIVIALGVVVAAGFYFFNKDKSLPTGQNQEKPFSVEKKELSATQIPSGLPQNMPMEKGSSVLQNYEATTTDGRKQSTRIISTALTLEAAKSSYQDFFSSLGWTLISSDSKSGNSATALLRRKDDVVIIVARNNSSTQERTVEITLTESISNK